MNQQMDILREQEKRLRFEKFDSAKALRLGNFMAERMEKLGVRVGVSIRLTSGCTVFQYLPDGMGLLIENWLRRKSNMVIWMGCSSLTAKHVLEAKQETLEDHGLSAADHVLCGGGFPIRLKGSGLVLGCIAASGLDEIGDHEFVAGSLREFLNMPDVPALRR